MSEIRFRYKPKLTIFILAVVFFGVCAGLMARAAIINDRGLVLNRIIDMSTQSATIFYWVITAASLGFVVMGLAALLKSRSSNREIILTDSSITAPKNLFSKVDLTVSFDSVTDFHVQSISKTRLLNIEYVGGKLSIPDNMLPSKSEFDELLAQFKLRLNG
ncbi:MAG: hypothetical protein AAF438_05670 [Pseudomonadota bacterium]